MSVFVKALKRMSAARTWEKDSALKASKSLPAGEKLSKLTPKPGRKSAKPRPSVVKHNVNVVNLDREKLERDGVIVHDNASSRVADQYRRIKRPLLDNAFGQNSSLVKHANILMITSAVPGEGKTFTSMNLALSMAREKDRTVLLVDADVAKSGGISKMLGLGGKPGLMDLLNSESMDIDDVLYCTDEKNLSILPAGSRDQHATELLASERMAGIVDDMAGRYSDRIVVFDCPPLLVTSEALVLTSLAGQVAVVVQAGKTPQNVVRQAVDLLDNDKAVNLILNKNEGGLGLPYYGGYYDYEKK